MKKVVLLILSIIIIVSLSACGGNSNIISENDPKEGTIKHTGKKISGEITAASVYSDSLAFVCLNGNTNKMYCIDKKSNIVFEFENDTQYVLDIIPIRFKRGYAFVNGAICDKQGKFVYPEDVGVTQFYDYALDGGFIIATRITADYNSSKRELGIMNTSFEWVLQPSEKIYSELESGLLASTYGDSESFYSNGYIYFSGCRKYLNIVTGDVSDSVDSLLSMDTWIYNHDRTLINTNGEVMLDLKCVPNIENTGNNTYKNGRIPLVLYNQEVGKRFWTLADDNLKFLFNPVEMVDYNIESHKNWVKFDGEYVVIYDAPTNKLISYNSKGEKLGELYVEDLSSGYVDEGTILLVSGTNSKKYHYYNADFNSLFQK